MKKYTSLLAIMSLALLTVVIVIPPGHSQDAGPIIDTLRHTVVSPRVPFMQLYALLTDVADMSPDQTSTADIDQLYENGFTITEDLGFNIGFIGYNIRDLADPSVNYGYKEELIGKFWPLHDAEFRHALIHSYDQLGIIPPIYGYIATPIRSLVPPAQSKYYNSAVPAHPYNPGDPFTSPSTEHSSCGILKAAGYSFVDADSSGTVTEADYWTMPNLAPMVKMTLWYPVNDRAPDHEMHCYEFVADLQTIGLAATAANGGKGFEEHQINFNTCLSLVYGTATQSGGQFDAFIMFHSLGSLPNQLYSLCHSSQDSVVRAGARNAVGINDPTVDNQVDTVIYSTDTDAIEDAAKAAQERLYDPTLPNADNFALAYMMLYSKSYIYAYDQNLRNIVRSPGYGSDNMWTYLNLNWVPGTERTEDGRTTAISMNSDPPYSLNPTWATTESEWDIVGLTVDSLIAVNPYNHNDIPWIASDWTITPGEHGWMIIDFYLRDDVYWQDGYPFTAYDVEFNLEFLRTYEVPRYWGSSHILLDVEVISATHCQVYALEESLSAFYDFSAAATLLPPQIWDRNWASYEVVLNYHPEDYPYGADMAYGYDPGPWASDVPTNLFGTGPFVFQFYDPYGMYDDLWRNEHYFMTQDAIATLMTNMFWEVGDQNRNGIVNVVDLTFVSFAFGSMIGDPNYDADSDFDSNGIVDIRDVANCAYHLSWQKFYP